MFRTRVLLIRTKKNVAAPAHHSSSNLNLTFQIQTMKLTTLGRGGKLESEETCPHEIYSRTLSQSPTTFSGEPMTITTNAFPKNREEEFSNRPATSRLETAIELAAGTALSIYGIVRRDWFGAGFAAGGGYLLYCVASDLRRPYQGSVRVGFTIAKLPQEVYEFVRNPQNWKIGVPGVELEPDANGGLSVRFGDGDRCSLNTRVAVTEEKPGEYIAWASDIHMIEHRGVVHFKQAPGGRGTELSVAMEYKAPTGPISRSLAMMAGFDPEQIVREGLRRIKQLMEAGEIPTTNGQPVGARGVRGVAKRVIFRERPARERPAIDTQPQRLAGD